MWPDLPIGSYTCTVSSLTIHHQTGTTLDWQFVGIYSTDYPQVKIKLNSSHVSHAWSAFGCWYCYICVYICNGTHVHMQVHPLLTCEVTSVYVISIYYMYVLTIYFCLATYFPIGLQQWVYHTMTRFAKT